MTVRDFEALQMPDKIKVLYTEGSFVTAIRYYGYKVNLYLLAGFYVEVFFHHLQDRIEKIEPADFNSTRLKFYTDQIKLPGDLAL